MKTSPTLLLAFLFSAMVYSGCSKRNYAAGQNHAKNNEGAAEWYLAHEKKVADAKAYFDTAENNIVPKRERKNLMWNKAYLTEVNGINKVTVAFKMGKSKSSTSNAAEASGSKRHLYIYKDGSGVYVMELVNY